MMLYGQYDPKERYRKIMFANGEYVLDTKPPSEKCQVEAAKDDAHGDWKSIDLRKIYVGESLILEGFFDNLYGLWARVRKADGTYLDVHPSSLNMVDSPAPLIK